MTTSDPNPNKRANISLAEVLKESKKVKQKNGQLPCRVVPYETNTSFVGRSATLKELKTLLPPSNVPNPQKQTSVQLCGAGGVGKTQTALSFVFNNLDTYQAILVASAENEEKLLASYAEFAYQLGLVPSIAEDQKKSVSLAISWFEDATVPWLVVFDNFDGGPGSDFLLEYWPRGKWGSVLVTSRDREALSPFPGTTMMLDPLEEAEAVELLFKISQRTSSPIEEKSAKWIASELGYLPLGIVNAGSSIEVNGWSFEEYKGLFNPAEVIHASKPLRGSALRYPYSLDTVWNSELSRLKKEPGSLALIHVIAFFHSDIHEDLLSMAKPGIKPEEFRLRNHPYVAFQKHFAKFRARLARSGLTSQVKTANGNQLYVHRLFQEKCHLEMSPQEKQKAFDIALFLIRFAWPVPERCNRHNSAFWERQQICVPHIAKLNHFYKLSHNPDTPEYSSHPIKADRSFAQMLYDAGWYHYERGNMGLSLEFLHEAKIWCDANPDDCLLLTADIWGAFASVNSETNNYRSALDGFRRQAEFCDKARSKGLLSSPSTRETTIYGDLADGCHALNKYEEAETYYTLALGAWQGEPGDNLYEIHLGTCLTLQNKLVEAERVFLKIISDRRKRFGDNDTASFRNGVLLLAYGNLLARQQRSPKAMEAYRDSLAILKKTMGDDHHRTADVRYKIGWQSHLNNNNEIAIKAWEQALDSYDMDSSYRNESARTKYALFLAHTAMNTTVDREKAARYLREAEQLRKEILGKNWTQSWTIEDYDTMIMCWSR